MPELLVIVLVPVGIVLMATMFILGISAAGGMPPVADALPAAEPQSDAP